MLMLLPSSMALISMEVQHRSFCGIIDAVSSADYCNIKPAAKSAVAQQLGAEILATAGVTLLNLPKNRCGADSVEGTAAQMLAERATLHLHTYESH